jgi:hypothetical protein
MVACRFDGSMASLDGLLWDRKVFADDAINVLRWTGDLVSHDSLLGVEDDHKHIVSSGLAPARGIPIFIYRAA